MSNPYVKKEVTKILEDKKYEAPLNLAMAAAWIIANFKGVNIKILDSSKTSSLCDYNILATAENTIAARAMVDEFLSTLKETDKEAISLEGMADGEWILLDLGEIIIHIFQENTRDVFDLDGLWSSLEHIQIPQEFYFSSNDSNEPQPPSEQSYF